MTPLSLCQDLNELLTVDKPSECNNVYSLFYFPGFSKYASLLRNTLGAKKSISTDELKSFTELHELNKCM